jgi:hypothetical protein
MAHARRSAAACLRSASPRPTLLREGSKRDEGCTSAKILGAALPWSISDSRRAERCWALGYCVPDLGDVAVLCIGCAEA